MKLAGDRNNNENAALAGEAGRYRQLPSPGSRPRSPVGSSSSGVGSEAPGAIRRALCSTAPLPAGSKYLAVQLLSGERLLLALEVRAWSCVAKEVGCGDEAEDRPFYTAQKLKKEDDERSQVGKADSPRKFVILFF